MDLERRLELIRAPPTQEIITEEELRSLLQTNDKPIAYDGFEPSGLAHLGFGLVRAIKLRDMLEAGCRFKLFLADWHAWINNKMGGDLAKIQRVGEYLVEVWKAVGIDTSKVEVVWASDVVKDAEYWKRVIRVAKATTLSRMQRSLTIMGRREGELADTAQYFYPAMQVADIFTLNVDICQLGIDQRRANILAREVAEKYKWKKPVAVHHHLLIGLQGPSKMGAENVFETKEELDLEIASKMSKSKPQTAIFVHDSPDEIRKKIHEAFCPPQKVEGNPLLEMCRYIIFRSRPSMAIERPAKSGGSIELAGYEELEDLYRQGKIHPLDLKAAVATDIIHLLKPVRDHFSKVGPSKLLAEIRAAEVTR